MIFVPYAIVDEYTVMIKLLDTFFAVDAVESSPRFDDFTIETKILKVNASLISNS
jgi:hypothetical protein